MSVILDASASLAWVIDDERTKAVEAIFVDVSVGGALVPVHWALEVANTLSLGVRKGRFVASTRTQMLASLLALPIETDAHTGAHAWSDTLTLADHHRLTVYDAAYLELALRRRLPLATLDKKLITAAQASGVPILP